MNQALLAFWKLLANDASEVAGGLGLSSAPVPLSFANGVWQPDPLKLADAAAWCRQHHMPPAIIWSGDQSPPGAGDLSLEVRLELVGAEAAENDPGEHRPDLMVEQIGWQHCRPVAELFARRHDRMDVEEELSLILARALQDDARMVAYLAYQGDRIAAGGIALIAAQDTIAWLEGEAVPALVSRLAQDAPDTSLQLLRVEVDPATTPWSGVGRWLLEPSAAS